MVYCLTGVVWLTWSRTNEIRRRPARPNSLEPVLILPCPIQSICPIATLRSYLRVAEPKRNTIGRSLGTQAIWDDRLFLSLGGKIRCIFSSTLGGRLTDLLVNVGIRGYTADSFRHAGTSRAIKDGAPQERKHVGAAGSQRLPPWESIT